MKKINFIIMLLFTVLSCQFVDKIDFSKLKVNMVRDSNYLEVQLKDEKGLLLHSGKLKDFDILNSKIDALFFDSLLYRNGGISLSPCYWELFLKKNNYFSFAFVDLDGINYVLENKLKVKTIIPFNTYQGTLLQNIILDSQFPQSMRANTISTYSNEWSNINTTYSYNEKVEINKYSDVLSNEDRPYLPKNTIFTMSDFCNFTSNIDVVEKINKDKEDTNLYVCIFKKQRINTSKFDRDDLFFKFEQYLNKNGFLQIKKSLLNPYSFNRKRVYIFE